MEDTMRTDSSRHSVAPILAVCLAVLIAVALVGCSGGGSSSGGTTGSSTSTGGTSTPALTITEQNLQFNPPSITAKVGDTVTFTNNDSAPHNVKIDGQELGSQNQGESKTWNATKAGSFAYSCTIHPSMTGVITVN
jgi:plastocyanin